MHVHFLLAGLLFAWVIAGPDPFPHRPSVRVRLVVLGIAVAGHATVAQLMYAGVFATLPESAADVRAGAELMYYAGDIAELLLALALLTARPWRPAPGRRGRRTAAESGRPRSRTVRRGPVRDLPALGTNRTAARSVSTPARNRLL